MKIAGNRNCVKFDLENGVVIKAYGEMLAGRKFIVYKNTMKFCDALHKNMELSSKQIDDIINEVQKNMNENTIELIFI